MEKKEDRIWTTRVRTTTMKTEVRIWTTRVRTTTMKTEVKINNFMWPWSIHKIICMILHKPVAMNKRDDLY